MSDHGGNFGSKKVVFTKIKSPESSAKVGGFTALMTDSKYHSAKPSSNDSEIRYRTIPPQNIVLRLIRRETCPPKSCVSRYHAAREYHQNVFPNFTVVNVEKPACFLRKFCPSGQYFVAFSSDQTSIEIYEYQGPAAAGDLMKDVTGEHTNNVSDKDTLKIRGRIFEKFFKLLHVVNVATHGEQLNRECSLFTDNSKFVIVGSAAFLPEDSQPPFFDIYQNNESVSPNPRSFLEDYSLHLIDLVHGKLCHTKSFKTDKIFLSHNQGLYLYQDTLAVLSVQHQTIHIFKVSDEGCFLNVRTIGRFCYEDDEFLVTTALCKERGSAGNRSLTRPFREGSINSLKHRLLVFLYQKAVAESQKEKSPRPLRKFYQHFNQFCKLRMWKMQLLDQDHILIKYASEEVITLRLSDPNSQPCFFVIYNILTTKVIAVFENTSEDLLELFENFCDLFRNTALRSESQLTCSPSNNTYSRLVQQRFKQTIINAKNGGHTEATKRLLTQLPISSQSYSSSPYLDLSLFSYDDKWVSVMERPKACGDHPIRFYARDSGLLKFKIYAGVQGRSAPPGSRRLVAFTFHPHDPFAISVQRTNTEYVVNFHIRHTPTT